MSIREEYTFLSSDERKTNLHAVKWIPSDNKINEVLLIHHGMEEFILKYDEFANFLADNHIAVMGYDQIGHGESVENKDDLGVMHTNSPAEIMVKDMLSHYKIAQDNFKGKPIFMLGHSMGSYLLRMFLSFYSSNLKDLKGAILIGTGTESDKGLEVAEHILKKLASIRGWNYKSKIIHMFMFERAIRYYDVTGKNPAHNWMTKNIKKVEEYYECPLTNFMFSLNGYKLLLDAIYYDNQQENIEKIRKDLPVIFLSGKDDVVGNMGKGVEEAADKFRAANIKDVFMKLYTNDRHEILSEPDRKVVYNDILSWIKDKAKV